MFKFVPNEFNWKLVETGQISLIRYKILREDEDCLIENSPWFKCTDYFNDVVYRSYGHKMSVHGFNNHDLVFNNILYISVKCIGKHFISNLEVINQHLVSLGHEGVEMVEVVGLPTNQLVLAIPDYYCRNTGYISTVLAFIRRCSYSDVVTKNNIYETEQKLNRLHLSSSFKQKFDKMFNPKYKKFMDEHVAPVGECSFTRNNVFDKTCKFDLHDAGMMSWTCRADDLEEVL